MESNLALQVQSLSMKYGDFEALSNVSFSINSGEIFGFLGPNGAGKTTTIKLLAGLFAPVEGEIHVFGHSMADSPAKAKMSIGYIPDRPFLYDKLTGDEYVAFVAGLWGMDKQEALTNVTTFLEKFEIVQVRSQMIEGYSHGMKQKLVMSAALVHCPKLLIVDEPTVGLDPSSVLVMKALFKEMSQSGCSVFLSTHSLAIAEAVCHRIAIINHGKIIALGTIDELRKLASVDNGSLENLFMVLTNDQSNLNM